MSCENINKNLLIGSKFKVAFDRLPDVSFFATEASIPGLSLSQNPVGSPFVDRMAAGDKLTYDPVAITFLVNEDLSPWKEIHNWMRGVGFPTDFAEYRNLANTMPVQMIASQSFIKPQYSDGTLIVYTNKNNPILRVSFKNLFPIELTSIDLSTKLTPNDVISATVRFSYTYYDLS